MDHNLEDTLTMEGLGSMEFDNSGEIVNQEDITLESVGPNSANIQMDLDGIEDQTTLLHTAGTEIVVPDLMDEQFGFQDYSVQISSDTSGANITIEANDINELSAQNEQLMNFQTIPVTTVAPQITNVISVKTVPQKPVKKNFSNPPREVAIAPKPPKIAPAPTVQYAIAPKPITLVMNKSTVAKKIALKGVVQSANVKGKLQDLAQLKMVPSGSNNPGQKIHIVKCSPQQAQLLGKGGKSFQQLTKVIVQGQTPATEANSPAVITKLLPVTTPTQTRYVMQQKTIPISNVVMTSPVKQNVKVNPRKKIISLTKSPSPKSSPSQGNITTKKVLIKSTPSQNIVIKAGATNASTQLLKDSVSTPRQHTQLHPINVPGKGIQYIKLVTNQAPTQKTAPKSQQMTLPSSNFVFTDSKGNLIQMVAEKVTSTQSQSLMQQASPAVTTVKNISTKKLVKIAPLTQKTVTSTQASAQPARSSQSLLAPIYIRSNIPKSEANSTTVSIEEFNDMVEQNNLSNFGAMTNEENDPGSATQPADAVQEEYQNPTNEVDIKPSLESLVTDAVAGEENVHDMAGGIHEVEIAYDTTPNKPEVALQQIPIEYEEGSGSMDQDTSGARNDNSLIVIPSNVSERNDTNNGSMYQEDADISTDGNDNNLSAMMSVDAEVVPYMSPGSQQMYANTDTLYEGNEDASSLRPRKACNCTKSQCLKLYCDCFANGEFCNACNCNNCHNNLENEELRQKAIRACLERNPNAFRPKIGKTKAGGPEIIRRHNKGCNCKRSGCLKNYCECYEAKIACTLMCKCVGCRNIEETLERRRDAIRIRDKLCAKGSPFRPPMTSGQIKQPCSFLTPEVIEAVCQCMLASAAERDEAQTEYIDPFEAVIQEFSRCMADIITASHQVL